MASKKNKGGDYKWLQLASVVTILALAAVVITIIVTGGVSEIKIGGGAEPGTLEAVEELPAVATSDNPVSINVDPEITSGETETLAVSYYNLGFPECEESGARVRVSPQDETLNITYQSNIVKVPVGNSTYIPFTITANVDPAPYRTTFEIVCDDNKVALYSTTIQILRE